MIDAISPPYIYGFICSQERLEAVQRRATPAEAAVLEDYRLTYKGAVGYFPHGLHYLHIPGEPETVPVWFGPVA